MISNIVVYGGSALISGTVGGQACRTLGVVNKPAMLIVLAGTVVLCLAVITTIHVINVLVHSLVAR